MSKELSTAGLVDRSLRHFWRSHTGVVLGAACATAVLVGALAVGDSVRLSLGEQARNRIGQVHGALVVNDRYFRADLADRIQQAAGGSGLVAPMLRFQGLARNQASASRAGLVDVHGVDERFLQLGPRGSRRPLPAAGEAFLNERLAMHLGVSAGDPILLRIEKPSLLPRDMLMATIDDISFALRLKVKGILSEQEFGRFGLRASQVPPFNVFVSLSWLQQQLDLENSANVLLASTMVGTNEALRRTWTLEDAGLHLIIPEGRSLFEITSDRVFLDPPVVEAIRRVQPGCVGILTYFVNELRHDQRKTPYSMVTALGALSGEVTHPELVKLLEILPADLGPDGIAVNEWLTTDLQLKMGDTVAVDYFLMGPQLQLLETTHRLRVGGIVPLDGAAADPSLMPAFPGLEDTENCRDWEPGIPIDLSRIRDKDEEYWDEHRGTPKAFLSLETGQGLFRNRYGSLTAVRGPRGSGDLAERLPRAVDPRLVGLFFQDVRAPALESGAPATDFGGLFLGLSFFLIVAALILTALLFGFGVQHRGNEIGLLLAVGFRPKQVRGLFLVEALVLAVVGSILGVGLGMGYTKAVLVGLGTIWRDAVGMTTLTFHFRPTTVAVGTMIGIVMALFAIWLTLRGALTHPAVELLQSRNGIPARSVRGDPGRGRISLILAVVAPGLAIVLVILASGSSSAEQAAGAFFGAGALLLVAAIAGCRRLLTRLAGTGRRTIASVTALGLSNTGRRRGRSLATIALLASGTFLVVAVQANRLEPPRDPSVRASGTGGFTLFGRSTLPVLRDLGSPAGREAYGLTADQLEGASIVPLRVREGDDASCLNLSLPQNPRLVGVQPQALAGREAFEFVDHLLPADPREQDPSRSAWLLLEVDYGRDVVPAIGDAASVTWTLHKKVGDTLAYRDEQGRPFQVRIVGTVRNSILQGNLIVAEEQLRVRFPSASGYRMFLIDAPGERAQAIASSLTGALADIGFEVTSTADRLQAFNAVQNTYLLIFQLLGGLGLLLGSVGVGMVVLRNTLERRSELAVLGAVGYPHGAIQRLVWSEHGVLLGLGLASGVVAALVAVLPGGAVGQSIMAMLLLVVTVAASGALWVWIASTLATRGPLLDALRDE